MLDCAPGGAFLELSCLAASNVSCHLEGVRDGKNEYWCDYYFLVVMVGGRCAGGFGGEPSPVLLSSRALELRCPLHLVRNMS